MKKLLLILMFFPILLFSQTADFSDAGINLTVLPDSTAFQYPVANDTLRATQSLKLRAYVRYIMAKVGVGTDLFSTAREVLIVNAGGDSTEWRVLVDDDIPNTITASNYVLLTAVDDSADARITYAITQAKTLTGDWVNTSYPWADNEVANDITASNYLLLTATNDSVIAIVNNTAEADVDTTNLATTKWTTYIQNHQQAGASDSVFYSVATDTLKAITGNSIYLADTLTNVSALTGLAYIETDSINVDSLVVADWISLPADAISDAAVVNTITATNYLLLSAVDDSVAALETGDTLTWNWGVMDTVIVQALPGWKVPYDITVIKVSAYTDANTTTFNIEERAAATPNTAGTDMFAADMVAVATSLDSTSFTNAGFAKDTWMVPTISATGDVAIFSITVRYVK